MPRLTIAFAPLMLLLCLDAAPALADPAATIVIRDRQFVPREITVPANTKVELIVKNEQTVPAEFESNSLHREKVVMPGAQISVFVGPLAPGRYDFFDDYNRSATGVLVAQ